MKIKHKMKLKELLHNEGYNQICFDDIGLWNKDAGIDTDTIYVLNRSSFYNKSYKEIDIKIKEIEIIINDYSLF